MFKKNTTSVIIQWSALVWSRLKTLHLYLYLFSEHFLLSAPGWICRCRCWHYWMPAVWDHLHWAPEHGPRQDHTGRDRSLPQEEPVWTHGQPRSSGQLKQKICWLEFKTVYWEMPETKFSWAYIIQKKQSNREFGNRNVVLVRMSSKLSCFVLNCSFPPQPLSVC